MPENMLDKIRTYFATQPVDKAWLFGSYARGEQTPDSDVDLLVAFDKNARVSLLDRSIMIYQLEDLLTSKVDLVKEGTLFPFAVDSVNKDKILIYERS